MTPQDEIRMIGWMVEYEEMVQEGLLATNPQTILQITQAIKDCTGIVWLVGNGGSGALASHMATDLQLAGVRAQAFTDMTAITTYGNDFGFENCFLQGLRRVVGSGDIVVMISTSGESENLIVVARYLRSFESRWMNKVITLTGKGGGRLAGIGDINLIVPANHTGAVQDIQQSILHMIAYWLMKDKETK